ncbi:hypothetical protein SDC9_158314 [bioreactor metagenome]|uniref:Uncharacterized protein n=1 Tax=bioreactor metagenome TaxID=1076179 RepID=A0A645FBM6_9ZZZZ
MDIVHTCHVCPEELHENDTAQSGDHNCAPKAFPRFAGANARNHLMTANERSHRVGPHIAELGDQDEIEQVKLALDAREKIDLLHEIEQVWDVHQPEQRARNRQDSGRIALGEELTQTQAQDEQNDKAGLEIINAGKGIRRPDASGQVQEGAHHEQHTA